MGKDKKHKKVKKGDHPALAAEATHAEPKAVKAQEKSSAKSVEKPSARSQVKIDALVLEIIERVADKWTMVVLDVLARHGVTRFTRLGKLSGGVSQKMLTRTLRQMESDGLVKRTVHPVVPPHVDYELTELGKSLGEAFRGVWLWTEKNYDAVHQSRTAFRHKP